MADVVTFMLKPRAMVAEQFIVARNVGEGVAEYEFFAVCNILLFPRKFPCLEFCTHAVKREIHAAHVE